MKGLSRVEREKAKEMVSEDVKQKGEGAVSTIVNLVEEAKAATEGVKSPKYALVSICRRHRRCCVPYGGCSSRMIGDVAAGS